MKPIDILKKNLKDNDKHMKKATIISGVFFLLIVISLIIVRVYNVSQWVFVITFFVSSVVIPWAYNKNEKM